MESVRRIVTKENQEGKGLVFSTGKAAFEKWPGADAGSVVIWSTARVPADNSDGDLEGATRKIGMTLHSGSVFRVTELGPGFQTPCIAPFRQTTASFCPEHWSSFCMVGKGSLCFLDTPWRSAEQTMPGAIRTNRSHLGL